MLAVQSPCWPHTLPPPFPLTPRHLYKLLKFFQDVGCWTCMGWCLWAWEVLLESVGEAGFLSQGLPHSLLLHLMEPLSKKAELLSSRDLGIDGQGLLPIAVKSGVRSSWRASESRDCHCDLLVWHSAPSSLASGMGSFKTPASLDALSL